MYKGQTKSVPTRRLHPVRLYDLVESRMIAPQNPPLIQPLRIPHRIPPRQEPTIPSALDSDTSQGLRGAGRCGSPYNSGVRAAHVVLESSGEISSTGEPSYSSVETGPAVVVDCDVHVGVQHCGEIGLGFQKVELVDGGFGGGDLVEEAET